MDFFEDQEDESQKPKPISTQEQKVFEVMGKGICSNAIIGDKLNISANTVKNHKENIKKKLKVKTCSQLLELAVQNKLLTAEDKPKE